jgi:hypothetical protein
MKMLYIWLSQDKTFILYVCLNINIQIIKIFNIILWRFTRLNYFFKKFISTNNTMGIVWQI